MYKLFPRLILALALTITTGCKRDDADNKKSTDSTHDHAHGDHAHDHGDHSHDHHAHGDDHNEVFLGVVSMGDIKVSAAQGHGKVEPGKEIHLVVKLPYTDNGSTVVRAWIGTEDRTASMVGKGEYAAAHDDYDLHTNAPDPLPENTMWWIEIEKPDGTTMTGSIKPLMN